MATLDSVPATCGVLAKVIASGEYLVGSSKNDRTSVFGTRFRGAHNPYLGKIELCLGGGLRVRCDRDALGSDAKHPQQ